MQLHAHLVLSFKNKPRPLLVKLFHILTLIMFYMIDPMFAKDILVKPDMNCEERHRESLLLKERWNLMCSGIEKKLKSTAVNSLLRTSFIVKSVTQILCQKWSSETDLHLTPIDQLLYTPMPQASSTNMNNSSH